MVPAESGAKRAGIHPRPSFLPSGAPIACFHFGVAERWTLNSWDAMIIPKPFSRVCLRMARLIRVPADADDQALARFHAEMQQALERARDFAEAQVHSRAGKGEATGEESL